MAMNFFQKQNRKVRMREEATPGNMESRSRSNGVKERARNGRGGGYQGKRRKGIIYMFRYKSLRVPENTVIQAEHQNLRKRKEPLGIVTLVKVLAPAERQKKARTQRKRIYCAGKKVVPRADSKDLDEPKRDNASKYITGSCQTRQVGKNIRGGKEIVKRGLGNSSAPGPCIQSQTKKIGLLKAKGKW